MEKPSASDVAAALNLSIWKFRPPIPNNARSVRFVLHFLRKGKAPIEIAELSSGPDPTRSVTTTLRMDPGSSPDASEEIAIFLGQGGLSLTTRMPNYFKGQTVMTRGELRRDSEGRILLIGSRDDGVGMAAGLVSDQDSALYLTVEGE